MPMHILVLVYYDWNPNAFGKLLNTSHAKSFVQKI